MENMKYAEELVREFLFFRGFTSTLQSFDKELATDIGKDFHKDKIFDLIFSLYIPKFQPDNLISLLTFFKQCFSSSETLLISTLSKLEISILRYYIVNCVKFGRNDKIIEFFKVYGDDLIRKDQDWMIWFGIGYMKNPNLDPLFRVYFSKEWFDALNLSVRNFLSEIFNGNRIPALLKISSEKHTVNHLKNDIKHLNTRLSQLQALLEEKEAQLSQSRSNILTARQLSISGNGDSPRSTVESRSTGLHKELTVSSSDPHPSRRQSLGKDVVLPEDQDASPATNNCDGSDELQQEEDFPEVKVDFQETFLGHTSPISCCRFSTSGDNIASASVDGTVRIWTYDSSTSASRNATIYCGAEIMSLEWDCKSDRLLLIGTADGGIKAWNVDAKRVVCDLSTTSEFPSVVDLKCSPVEPIFVSAAASRGHGSSYIDKLGFASLTVWNMRTWKPMAVLPLGKDPPAITSLCFNHNGKILAAAATDGMIHMFDMSAGLQITGWPAHDSAISSVLFGPDETSIFSLGIDGKVFEWSLQNQGKVLWSRNCHRFCNPENSQNYRHEMALDANGKRLLVTSGSVRAPIYQVQDNTNGMKTLAHSAPISTVDWHPTLPIFLTGSVDNSVRVTSIL
ncbi:putative transcription factor WD40-like family [Helianthus annuus]|uniref:WD repeat-containing protein 91 homolog n=1 Tax=Helianthus annuus TaxID=4232 RepID=UPI000B8FF0C3|nr:WD repeat-containing protein 91 homolog [Helianthus annuus]KAJ0468329.1 putative transcription factor WD40-like family [Helianthus annuus]